MPDKEFEQQLRDGLHDWQVTPPPPVRDAVLEAVRRRRRRRGLLWIPLGLLLLGAGLGGYYALRESPAMPRPDGSPTPGAAPVASSAAPVTVQAAPGTTKAAQMAAGAVTPTPGGSTATPFVGSVAPGAKTLTQGGKNPTPDAITLRKTVAEQSAISAVTPAAYEVTPTPSREWVAQDKPDLAANYAVVPLPAMPWTSGKINHRPLAIAQNPIRTGRTESPWSFHIHASTGATGQGAFLSFGAPAKNQQVVFRDPTNPINNAYPSTGNGGTDTLAGRSAGWGWSVGLSVARRLSDRFKVDAGLAFTQAETRIGPLNHHGGSYLGYTAAGQVYNVGGSTGPYTQVTYVNSYRLLSLPVDVSWSVAPRTRVQPSVSLGVAPAYLFSGDAVMYNPEYSGYEVSKGLYRHWQWSGEIGLTGNLFRFRDGKSITIGPFLQYGFSSLQKPAPVQDHVNYAGIRLDLGLPGKKTKP